MSRLTEALRRFDAAAEHHPPECTGDDRFTADHLDPADRAELRAICRRCPLIDECAALGIAVGAPGGFWAGVERHPPQPRPGRRKTVNA